MSVAANAGATLDMRSRCRDLARSLLPPLHDDNDNDNDDNDHDDNNDDDDDNDDSAREDIIPCDSSFTSGFIGRGGVGPGRNRSEDDLPARETCGAPASLLF